jgi:hypothetical protein
MQFSQRSGSGGIPEGNCRLTSSKIVKYAAIPQGSRLFFVKIC